MMLKQRYEPAETFSMAEDGFFGEMYLPAHNAFPGKCLILFGGSAGKFLLTQLVAEQFVDAGMTVLALAYHGALGLPKFLVEQPVDVIEQAAKHLKRIGYRKVGLWGISMGGCLALLAGSLLPELISCVVSVAPMELVPQGEVRKKPVLESAFSFHGQPLPYAPYVPSDGDAWYKAYRQATLLHKEPYQPRAAAGMLPAESHPRSSHPNLEHQRPHPVLRRRTGWDVSHPRDLRLSAVPAGSPSVPPSGGTPPLPPPRALCASREAHQRQVSPCRAGVPPGM